MKVLVANRGEIASRVFATARRLGHQTVAVYAEPDTSAPFVRQADEARCIGPASLEQSYLNIAAILDAAAETGADAVHPGYGLLSENADFARAVIDVGLTWIGPHPEAIAQMGSKIEARAIAESAGVPTIPGATEGDLSAAAERIGYPVLVKASAGGGGKGIRRVYRSAEFKAALGEARTEAMRSFGDDRVIVERYVERPRHVEVQVMGDTHGTVLHLGTRDCSSQRRYQKLLEEAPAPNLPEATRSGLAEAATALARQIRYDNAGTVEFIVDSDSGEFFFLEMNTRLQVEHTVTEQVTGLDLVELQLRAASGEPLPLAQSDVRFEGHSVQARINAEEPAANFSPQAGPVRHLEVPEVVRWDSGVEAGGEITPYYDPLIAKLVVTGPSRDAALDSLGAALERLVLGPVPTNAGFLRWLIDAPPLRQADMTTSWIDSLDSSVIPKPPEAADAAPAAAAAWLARQRQDRAGSNAGPWSALGSFRLTEHSSAAALVMRSPEGELLEVSRAEIERAPAPKAHSVGARSVAVNIDGHTVTFDVPERADAWATAADHVTGAVDAVTAPFPAVVVEVPVSPGDHVAAGEVVVVVEAMKMLHSLTAHGAGTVAEVRCGPGEAVEANQILVSFEKA